jgi:hypothetical protein
MLSFITVGRDDDYGGSFLDRLFTSISKNIEAAEKFNLRYEYLLVEWCPIKNYLIYNDKLKDLFRDKNLVDIIIKPEVSLKERLNPKIFYEYFAKNAGIRLSRFDILVILNADVILPEKTIGIIVDLARNFDKNHYYKPIRRVEVDHNLDIIKTESVHRPKHPDAATGGYFAGDILIVGRSAVIKYGEGYDETNPKHRTISQNKMDGEMLWNLYKKGITLQFLDADYWHIEHARPNVHDETYNMNGYANKSNWGFTDYPKKALSEKLIEIG